MSMNERETPDARFWKHFRELHPDADIFQPPHGTRTNINVMKAKAAVERMKSRSHAMPDTEAAGQIQATYTRIREGTVAFTRELFGQSGVNGDFDARGRLLGIETLWPVEVTIQGPVCVRVNDRGVEYSHG